MLTKRIEWYAEKQRLLSEFTTGFRRGRSSLDCLARLVTNIQIGFTVNHQTVACFLDIDGAYNNVLIEKLTTTLDDFGFGNKLCKYLWNYLSERRLKIQDNMDARNCITRSTYKGLAQGDPMSPLLFNIVTAKIFYKIVNVSICQYADDFVLFSSNKELLESSCKLQAALITFNELINNIGLELSVNKSKFCIFSRGHRRQGVELKINNTSLELVKFYKYLGVWLDRSLRWGKHIDETITKVQKCFNLLNVVTGSSWGVHTKHLRQIYLALIRSRIDYGSFLYANSAKCHLVKLDRLQNQAIRIIGGFIRTTPIHAMESELSIPPLRQRRRFLAIKYCLKSLSWTNNETIKSVKALSSLCSNNNYWANKTIPLLISKFNDVKEEPVSSSVCLEMFSLRTWITNINVKDIIKCNLDSVQKPKQKCEYNLSYEVIKELREKYAGWFVIYTDGSKSKEGLGAGFYVATKNDCNLYDNDCLNINGEICIMTVELIAISEALSYVKKFNNYNKVLICTDSKSALEHIARSASGIRGVSVAYAVLASIDEISSMGVDLRLQWVPSHIGLLGNEEADTLAKNGCRIGKIIKVKSNYTEFLPKYKQLCYKEWKEYFDKMSLEKGIWYRTLQCEPPHIPWSSFSRMKRKYVVLAHRLRSGHIPTNKFGHLLGKTPSPDCEVCGVVEDVHHLLVECVRFQAGREKLLDILNLNRLHVGVFHILLSNPNSDDACNLFRLLINN